MTHNYNINTIASSASGVIPSFPKSEDPDLWARKKIQSLTDPGDKISFFYKESLRFMVSKLGTLSYMNSENDLVGIKCIHANPERTIAKLKDETNIILPIISISQSSSANDDERRRNAPILINETYWSDLRKRAFRVLSLAPRPVNIEYNINIWAKYRANLDQVVEQIRLFFNPHMIVENSYTSVAHAFIENELDKSTVDVSDRQDRVMRRSFDISVEAYLPNPKFLITSTGEIEEFNNEVEIY